MVLCAVCTASRPPMSPLSAEHMKAFETMVSQSVNLEPLIKSHTILMCPPCMDQIEMVRKFQTAAVAGIKRLLSFLQGYNQPTSDPNNTVTVTIKQEPLDTLSEVKSEREDLETQAMELQCQISMSEEIVVKCEPDKVSTNDMETENRTQDTKIVTEAAKENNTAKKSTPAVTVLNNGSKIKPFTHQSANILSNCNTEGATPSTSKNSSTLALLKCNIYDPKFLSQYFTEARHSTKLETPLNDETVMAKSTDNSVRMPNGLISNTPSSAASTCTQRPTVSGSAATDLVNSHKQKNNRAKHIVNCSICGTTFLSKRFMEIHVRAKHGPKEAGASLYCGVCEVTSPTPAAHRVHIATVHNAARNQWKFQCDACARKLPTKGRLEEHKQRMHPNKTKAISERLLKLGSARRHRCGLCGASFALLSALHAHGKLAHGKLAQRKGKGKGKADKKSSAGKKGNDGEKRG